MGIVIPFDRVRRCSLKAARTPAADFYRHGARVVVWSMAWIAFGLVSASDGFWSGFAIASMLSLYGCAHFWIMYYRAYRAENPREEAKPHGPPNAA